MATEVLRPQDCLSHRIGVPPRRNYAANNAFLYRKPPRRRALHRRPVSDDSTLLMEKVTVLRRGDSLGSHLKTHPFQDQGRDLLLVGTRRLGPDPDTVVPEQIRNVDFNPVYAGSAFAVSPSPSALPLPSFFKKHAAVDDSATRDLRRLLGLE